MTANAFWNFKRKLPAWREAFAQQQLIQ